MSFDELGLCAPLLDALKQRNHHTPTQIQDAAIPVALTGQNVIACAPTGTGKTGAFLLPLLHRLNEVPPAHAVGPRALILTPTRELAEQITVDAHHYAHFMKIRSVAVIGGVSITGQINLMSHGCDILVATPGRLLDLMERRAVHLNHVEILVIDEADRMYDMGFIKDVRRIVGKVPRNRQTLLFSATMSDEVVQLIQDVAPEAHLVEVGARSLPVDTIEQRFCSVQSAKKIDFLRYLIRTEQVDLMLVFSDTRRGADRIAALLKARGIPAHAIHADRTQDQRRKLLDAFKTRRFRVMVATDLAARGIDIEGITHVINFETPCFVEDYVHRIGRTGRAEQSGVALTLVSLLEEDQARKIALKIGRTIEMECHEGYAEPDPVRMPKLQPGFGRNRVSAILSSGRSRRK